MTDVASRARVADGLRVSRQAALFGASACVLVAATWADFIWLASAVTWLLFAELVPAATWVRKLVLAVPLMAGGFACVFTLLAVSGVAADVRWVVLVGGLSAGAATTACRRRRRPVLLDRSDMWATGVSSLALLSVGHSLAGSTPGGYLAFLGWATDGSRHLTLASAVLSHHGYVTLTARPGEFVNGLDRYPQGLAGATSIVLRSLVGPSLDTASLLRIGTWAMLVMFGVMVWIATSVVLVAATNATRATLPARAAIAASLIVAAAFVVGPQLTTHVSGYFSQELATIMLLGIVALLLESGEPTLRNSAMVALLVVGTAQAWYLLSPVVFVIAGLYLRTVGAARWKHVGVILMAGPFVAFPVITGPNPGIKLVAAGITTVPSNVAVIAMLMLTAIGLLAAHLSPIDRTPMSGLTAAWLALCALAIGVSVYQLGAGGIGYYALKLFVLALLIGCLVGAAGVATVLTAAQRDGRKVVLIAAATVATVALIAASVGSFRDHTSISRSQRAHAREADAFLARHPENLPQGVLAFSADGCDWRDATLSQAFANLSGHWTPRLNKAETAFLISKPGSTHAIESLISDPSVREIEVYAHAPCRSAMVRYLAGLRKITVVNVP